MDMRFKKINFLIGDELIEVSIKGDFEQTACKHEYKKGKVIKAFKNKIFKSRLNKDINLCIKCGKKRGKK